MNTLSISMFLKIKMKMQTVFLFKERLKTVLKKMKNMDGF
jgi:hypothetical protein